MSEHPLSSITKSHISNCLRTVTNKRAGRFRTDNLYVGIGLTFSNDDNEVRDGVLRLVAEKNDADIIYSCTYHFKERHVEENILKEGEFKLTPDAIELVANKWFSEFQEAARRANNNDKTILH